MERNLKPSPGARHARKRVGRGAGSGHGTYSGRGQKGQKARSGRIIVRGFEGGQLPIFERLSKKRGFIHIFKVVASVVNLRQLKVFPANAEVTPEEMVRVGLVRDLARPIKVLGNGEISRPLHVKANRFSRTAMEKIAAAGGKAEVV